MHARKSFSGFGGTQNLRLLSAIRSILVLGQSIALFFAYFLWHIELAYAALIITLAIFTLVTLITIARLRSALFVSNSEFFGHLIIDIVCLSTLLYLTGGASNPFVSYFLVSICISAATLPWRFTWIVTGLSLAAYTLMFFFYVPLDIFSPNHSMHEPTRLNIHLLGMWINFLMSAVLITYFVVRMARAMRLHEEALQESQNEVTRNEHILGLATLAAGTAHELATPLSTMSVLISDLKKNSPDNLNYPAEIELLDHQVELCKDTLTRLTEIAEPDSYSELKDQKITEYIESLLQQWQVIRPDVHCSLRVLHHGAPPSIKTDIPLNQAIQNLLNNAADASLGSPIDITLDWNEREISFSILNNSDHIPETADSKTNALFISRKANPAQLGLGIGLVLSHSTIERHGGRLEVSTLEDNKFRTRLALPIVDRPTL